MRLQAIYIVPDYAANVEKQLTKLPKQMSICAVSVKNKRFTNVSADSLY